MRFVSYGVVAVELPIRQIQARKPASGKQGFRRSRLPNGVNNLGQEDDCCNGVSTSIWIEGSRRFFFKNRPEEPKNLRKEYCLPVLPSSIQIALIRPVGRLDYTAQLVTELRSSGFVFEAEGNEPIDLIKVPQGGSCIGHEAIAVEAEDLLKLVLICDRDRFIQVGQSPRT